MALKTQSIEELSNKLFANQSILIHGEAGVGKSTFANSAGDGEDTSPVLYLDSELSAGFLPKTKHNVDYVEIKSVSDFYDVREELLNISKSNGGDVGYKVIVLDSLTNLSEFVFEHVVGRRIGSQDKSRIADANTEFADWNAYASLMDGVIDFFIKVPALSILLGHSSTDTGANELAQTKIAIAGKKCRDKVVRTIQHIGELKKLGNDRRLSFEGGTYTTAKTKFHNFDPNFTNPTAVDVIDRFAAALKNNKG